jgi:putative ABC transport system substrate-binding protein
LNETPRVPSFLGGVMSEPVVQTSIENGVCVIALHRPAALNALDHNLTLGLRDAVFAVEHDRAVRCVVIRGGEHFMAGGDLKWFSGLIEGRSANEKTVLFQNLIHEVHAVIISLRRMAARAQQGSMPVIGWLGSGSPGPSAPGVTVFRQGLAEAGYFEGHNVAIEYRWAEGQYDRLPALAAELVRRQVAVIVATPIPAALAAKAATATIPIVFSAAADPVNLGLVGSLARPGGNATGVNFFQAELSAKQLSLLREFRPNAARIEVLVNPANANIEGLTKDVTAAAATLGVEIEIVQARDSREIEESFAMLVQKKADALLVGADSFFFNRRVQLATLTARHAIPAVFFNREFAEAGGLMSYGSSLSEMNRQLGVYTGRILKGAKPDELPVVQSTKFELVVNLVTARAIGLDVPPMLLARADEVIE